MKAWRATFKDHGVNIIESMKAPDQEWLYFDRPLPRKRDGSIDYNQFSRGGYVRYKVVTVKKTALTTAIEFYKWTDEGWEQIHWSWLRTVEKFEE